MSILDSVCIEEYHRRKRSAKLRYGKEMIEKQKRPIVIPEGRNASSAQSGPQKASTAPQRLPVNSVRFF